MNPTQVFYRARTVGECWEWQRGRTTGGYGRVRLPDGSTAYAHRVAYEQAVGPIPAGAVVRHKCDNPPCIRPEHLEVGTQADNGRDAVERGRIRTGELAPAAKWPDARVSDARALRATGMTYRAISEELEVPFTAVREWLQGRVRR